MAKRNGYFRIRLEENGIYIQLYPAQDGGEAVAASEIMDYLQKVRITDYDLNVLTQGLKNLQEPKVLRISDMVCNSAIDEQVRVQVRPDRMLAAVRLYPPSNGGRNYTKQDLLNALEKEGIRYGVVEKVVDALVATPVYCRDIVIAKGTPVKEGTDAVIEYHFDTKPLSKPKLNEDGTVDFHQLNIFTSVTEGQLLATLTPEQQGEDGMDVKGNRIPSRKIKKAVLKHGKNIRLSEDKLQMFSEVNGDVKLESGTVFVSNSYTVPADVDASTGDILYEGNVVVNGNVRTGFTIRAKGDIQVKGVVEGAMLYAGGNIVLTRGIQGMNRGTLEANGDIITKFIESASVKAGGNIRSGSILHSQVEAGDTIICEGRKSFVVGGNLSALNQIDVKTMGNRMGTITNVKLGLDLAVLDHYKEMQEEFQTNAEALEKSTQILMLFKKRLDSGQKIPPDKVAVIQAAGKDKIRLEERQETLHALLEETKKQIESNAKGYLKISDTIYPGVRIQIANTQYVVKDELRYCRFRLEGGEIISDTY